MSFSFEIIQGAIYALENNDDVNKITRFLNNERRCALQK